MQVEITKEESKKPYVCIRANEVAYEAVTIDEWIRQLRVAKAWLTRKTAK